MSAVEAETRSCGKCPNFDRYRIDGELVGTINLDVNGGVQQVQLGYCRATFGLSLGKRPEIAKCVHPQFKSEPFSIAEVQPEGILTESKKFLPEFSASR